MRGLDVAVVGGGIFGVTAALELAGHGNRVELFEQGDDLLLSASGINQYRLHRGYHYPRSRETAIDCRDSEPEFREAFPDAILDSDSHFYAIAARQSQVTADQYLAFCRSLDLEFERDRPDLLRPESIALSVRVRESLFDPEALRRIVWERLRATDVRVHLNARADRSDLAGYHQVVVATYAGLNRLLPESAQSLYQFEVCEKPVVRLPAAYAGQSVVVMDGPFMCFDPLGTTDRFVLGNVVHAIHHRSVGTFPDVPGGLADLLDRGVVEDPPITNIEHFVEAGTEVFEGFAELEHVGSMYTIRAVLPNVDGTDARPTLVREVDDRTISVFSGKIDTCIRAARKVAALVDERGRADELRTTAGSHAVAAKEVAENDRGAA